MRPSLKNKSLLLVLMFFIICNITWTNNFIKENTEFIKQYIIPNVQFNSSTDHIVYKSNNLFICSGFTLNTDDVYYAKVYDSEKETTYHLALNSNKKEGYVLGFDVDDNNFVLISDYKIYVFDRKNNNSLISSQKLLNGLGNKISIEGDEVIFKNNMITSSRIDSTNYTCLAKYSLKSNDYTLYRSFEDPTSVTLNNSLPRNLFDISSKFTVIANSDKYYVRIYDENYNMKYIINRKPNNWEVGDTNRINDVLEKAVQHSRNNEMREMFNIQRPIGQFSQMIFSEIVDDKLYLFWTKNIPNSMKLGNYFLDIWDLSAVKPLLIKSDIELFAMEPFSDYKPYELKVSPYNTILKDKYLIIKTENPFQTECIEDIDNLLFKKKVEDYYIDHPLKTSFYIYRLKND